MPKTPKGRVETPSSLTALAEIIDQEHIQEPPPGYHSVEEIVKLTNCKIDSVRERLRLLVKQGKADRVRVARGPKSRSYYYKLNDKKHK